MTFTPAEIEYLRTRTFRGDLRILARTAVVILLQLGALGPAVKRRRRRLRAQRVP